MRCVIASGIVAAFVLTATAAHAERRIFIIANNPDSYGVDRCLASGEPCGKMVANSYCRSREFAQAVSFRKVDRDDITSAVSLNDAGACQGGSCADYVAIECTR
jgi:hypothetical protein